jgi:demethoxyubiquinone hydroxylase (CLK1/Coq7/Cat5 family)
MRISDLHETLVALRGDLADELAAISRLEGQSFALADAEACEELRRLADDKKEHAATLVRTIARLDARFGERLGG